LLFADASLMSKKEQIDQDKLPSHIAIIMDGNGRWAKGQGKKRVFGHQHGVTAVRETTEACAELGVQYLTLYAFSTENWSRPKYEINTLMELLIKTIRDETETLVENNIRLRTIGNLDDLPSECRQNLKETKKATAGHDRMDLILALNYSSRYEIQQATRQIAKEVAEGQLRIEDIDENTINNHLYTATIPDPELLIRTSSEHRVSNFLLWQIAYSELYFPAKLWPEFRKEDLYQAVVDYQNRERRFGKISEQIQV